MTASDDQTVERIARSVLGDADLAAVTPVASGWSNRVLRHAHRDGGEVMLRLPRGDAAVDVAARCARPMQHTCARFAGCSTCLSSPEPRCAWPRAGTKQRFARSSGTASAP